MVRSRWQTWSETGLQSSDARWQAAFGHRRRRPIEADGLPPGREHHCALVDDGTIAGRKAVMGALSLYLDFINLFMLLLRLLGNRR